MTGKTDHRQVRKDHRRPVADDDPRLAVTGPSDLLRGWRQLLENGRWEVTISFSEYEYLFSRPCFYCGRTRTQCGRTSAVWVDRIDNDRPYEPVNVRASCAQCNWGKFRQSAESFMSHCAAVFWNHNDPVAEFAQWLGDNGMCIASVDFEAPQDMREVLEAYYER